MDVHELSAFVAVAEELNFRRAAERLNMSQPPLTRLIAKLEDHLNVKLFLRTTRQVEITAAGITLLKEARAILLHFAEAERSVREVGRLKRGSLSVGFSMMAFYSALPHIIWNFRDHFPKIDVDLSQGLPKKIWDDLGRGRCDIIFCEAVKDLDESIYESVEVSRHDLGVLLPSRHELADEKEIKLTDLRGSSFIMHPRYETPHFHDAVLAFLDGHKMKYSVRTRKRGENCAFLVASDKGLLLTIGSKSTQDVAGTSFLSLKNPAKVEFCAVWRRDEGSIARRALIHFIEEQNSLRDSPQGCLMSLGQSEGPGKGEPT